MNEEYQTWPDDQLNRELCIRMGWKWESIHDPEDATLRGRWVSSSGIIQPFLPLYTRSYDRTRELEDQYVNTPQRTAYYDGCLLTLLDFNREIEFADASGAATLDFVKLCARLRSVSPRCRIIALLALTDKFPGIFSITKTT